MRKILFLSFIVVVVGCSRPAPPMNTPTKSQTSESSDVQDVVRPQKKIVPRIVEQPGIIQAVEETHLYARIPGYVRRLRPEMDIGYKVKGPKYDSSDAMTEPGEVLAELDVPELEHDATQKEAIVRKADAEVEQARKAVIAAEAGIGLANAGVIEAKSLVTRWESESRRIGGLVQTGVIDAQSHDETLNQFRAAEGRMAAATANVEKAKADLGKAEADVTAAEARVEVAKADSNRAAAMLAFAKIRAPFDGIIVRRRVNTGDLVHPATGPNESLFTVARLDPVRITVAVPEADAGFVEEGVDVSLTIPSRGHSIAGKMNRTSWSLEPGSRTLRAEIDVPNPDGKLRPGMFVSAKITGRTSESWTLPSTAIIKQGDAFVCFLVENERAVRVNVQPGRSDGQSTEVLRFQRAGESTWREWSGSESVVQKAAGITDGQGIRPSSPSKSK